MDYVDFDVEGLARYLRLTPAQVTKMAERGHLPGRRIGGQWRFSPADINLWWEEKIGESKDGAELAQVEETLLHAPGPARSETEGDAAPSILKLLPREGISVPLIARTRNSVIEAMVELATATGLLWDPDKMADAVRSRESLHPTALDNGVALLHPRRPLPSILAEPFIALGITSQGIPFGHSRGVLTDIFFLICSTDDRTHLQVLARLSRLLNEPGMVDDLRSAADMYEVLDLLRDAETRLESVTE